MSVAEKIAENDHARAELDDVLSYHGGDAIAAVRSLLNDCRTLRVHLHTAELLMSSGYTRHWKPSGSEG